MAARLAALVAHPTAPRPFWIGPRDGHRNRSLPGWPSSVAEAAASGRCFAVTTAPDLLAFDLDTPDTAEAGHQLAAVLAGEGRPVLRVESGRPGHLHLWLVASDDLDREHLAERATGYGLTVRPGPMRPPLNPHHEGWPVTPIDDAAAFADRLEALRIVRARGQSDRLDWRDVLRSGRWPTGYDDGRYDLSGSAMVFAICRGAIRAGHDLDAVRAMLADSANLGGRCYRGHRARDKWLTEAVWPGAVESAGRLVTPPADAGEARERLDTLRAVVEAHPWKGRAGITDRSVLLAILDRGRVRGSTTPAMSVREIAEAAPCTRGTASTSTRRLKAAGWLQLAERGRGRTVTEAGENVERADASRWRLTDCLSAPKRDTGGTPPSGTPLSVAIVRVRASSEIDACRWRGLGLNAPRLLDALAGGPLRPAELAEAVTMHPGSVRRLVAKLAGHGLIVRTAGRWTLADDLDDAMTRTAERLGLVGKSAAVHRAHAVERGAYLDHREQNRAAREARKRRAIAAERPPRLAPHPVGAVASPDPPPTPPETPERAVYARLGAAGGRGG